MCADGAMVGETKDLGDATTDFGAETKDIGGETRYLGGNTKYCTSGPPSRSCSFTWESMERAAQDGWMGGVDKDTLSH